MRDVGAVGCFTVAMTTAMTCGRVTADRHAIVDRVLLEVLRRQYLRAVEVIGVAVLRRVVAVVGDLVTCLADAANASCACANRSQSLNVRVIVRVRVRV